jgi:hypothetical protein
MIASIPATCGITDNSNLLQDSVGIRQPIDLGNYRLVEALHLRMVL